MKKVKLIIIVLLVLLAAVIVIQNTKVVTMRLLFWEISMSLIIFVPFLLLIGFALGVLSAPSLFKKTRKAIGPEPESPPASSRPD